MTQTTAHRQLSLLIGGILKHYQVDNLQLEVDLTSAVYRMFEEKRDPAKLVEIRENVLKAMLGAAAKENELAQMEGRVKACTGIGIDGRNRYEDMLKFLVKKDKEGQTVEQYARWCKENPYDAPKMFQISQRPDLLIETWEMAFSRVSEEQPQREEGRGFYA